MLPHPAGTKHSDEHHDNILQVEGRRKGIQWKLTGGMNMATGFKAHCVLPAISVHSTYIFNEMFLIPEDNKEPLHQPCANVNECVTVYSEEAA